MELVGAIVEEESGVVEVDMEGDGGIEGLMGEIGRGGEGMRRKGRKGC